MIVQNGKFVVSGGKYIYPTRTTITDLYFKYTQKSIMEIKITIPKDEELISESQPTSYQGRDFPLEKLSDREFELLVYSVYKKEIESKTFEHDSIALMSGIRDKGSDCVLFVRNEKSGIIQCKHSSNNTRLKIKTCVQEIIKFALYYLQEKSLIPDKETFTYYFASSAGFSSDTLVYLNTFKRSISNEKDISKWATTVIKSYSLIKVTYDEIKKDLIDVLKSLTVKPIIPEDIQNLLRKHDGTVAGNFFSIRLVVDNKRLDKMELALNELNKNTKRNIPGPDKIISEFKQASIFLANYKSSFSLESPVQIERAATENLIKWIKDNLKEKEENLIVLKGGPGSGKSVILNNLYSKLIGYEIPTIALKADELSSETIAKLESKAGLSIPLVASIPILLQDFPKVVVIIDQLDALSQSLSANRNNLNSYILLIEKLKSIPNIRVIISTREYDLNYDPSLLPLKKNSFVDAGVLTEEEIRQVLKNLKVHGYSKKLVTLLSIPLHLELFCQIYNLSNDEVKLNSLYDLYNALWFLKLEERLAKSESNNLKRTIYKLSQKIYDQQTSLATSTAGFNSKDISYLKKEGLLIKNNRNEVLFFHQTFYDYVFARQFVESKRDVLSYLKENNQGVFIRSSLRIILAHVREYNTNQYIQLIKSLLTRIDVRYHLKKLVVDYLGFIDHPVRQEINLVEEIVLNTNLEILFLESVNSKEWIVVAINNQWLHNYMASTDHSKLNIPFSLFYRNINHSSDVILPYLEEWKSTDELDFFIARSLYNMSGWSESAMNLYFRTKRFLIRNPHLFCRCIELAVISNAKWALEELAATLNEKASNLTSSAHDIKIDHSVIELIKKLYLHFPDQIFLMCKNLIKIVVQKTVWRSYRKVAFIEDAAFAFFTHERGHLDEDDQLFSFFIKKVEESSKESNKNFKELIRDFGRSNFASLIRIAIYGIIVSPEQHNVDGFKILKHIYKKEGFVDSDKLDFYTRKLLASIYVFLTDSQKTWLNKAIMGISPSYEAEVFIHPITKQKARRNFVGHTQFKFLSAVPNAELIRFPEMYRRYQELERRYGKVKDSEPNVIRISGVYAPYKKESYERMTYKDWLKSFIKFNENHEPDFFSHKGGIHEHGRAFEEQVEMRPDYFFPFIKEIISNKSVANDYKIHGINGLKKANYTVREVGFLIEELILQPLQNIHKLYLVWSIDYLVQAKRVGSKVLDFLCEEALNNSDPSTDDSANPINKSINTVRGAAMDRLMRINNEQFSQKIFTTVEKSIKQEKTTAIKSTIIHNSAFLLNVNPDRAFAVFKKLLIRSPILIKQSMWSAGFFSRRYFNQMDFFMKVALRSKVVFPELSNLLSNEFIRGNEGSRKYLLPLLKKSSKAKAESVKVSVHPNNLINQDGTLNQKCVELFTWQLNTRSSEVIHQYSIAFLHFKNHMFNSLFPILESYSKSYAFRVSPAYFCKFVVNCCTKNNASKCLTLISKLPHLAKSDITKSTYYDSEPLNLVLAIYNSLGDNKQHMQYKEKCMDLFDKMLQQPQHREAANKAIELIDL